MQYLSVPTVAYFAATKVNSTEKFAITTSTLYTVGEHKPYDKDGTIMVTLPNGANISNYLINAYVRQTDIKYQGYCSVMPYGNNSWIIAVADDSSKNNFDFDLIIWQINNI